MSVEDLKRIDMNVEAEDPQEKEGLLNDRIAQISLVYADLKFKEITKEFSQKQEDGLYTDREIDID